MHPCYVVVPDPITCMYECRYYFLGSIYCALVLLPVTSVVGILVDTLISCL